MSILAKGRLVHSLNEVEESELQAAADTFCEAGQQARQAPIRPSMTQNHNDEEMVNDEVGDVVAGMDV